MSRAMIRTIMIMILSQGKSCFIPHHNGSVLFVKQRKNNYDKNTCKNLHIEKSGE
ncbi:hypothetical protein B4110_2497 [Parageobacillus toebii]|uniref:Uncharacterized protein n=1 Tax=Parageobacillus toebii TaxID=153151 RepID=A0A150MMH9_9BACL|nr:hypothetical protein B4110_2497 [Parageobacillus toebii]